MLSQENPDIAAAYDRWAATYDSDPNRTRDLAGAALREWGLGVDGRSVIEIGCGTGKNTAWLAARAAAVLALDISPGMLHKARTRVSAAHVSFARHDVRQPWPVATATADVVVGMLVLEHVAQLAPVFREAARVLRPGGALFVCELHPLRQMLGRQAAFTDPHTGARQPIAAYLHDVSAYVNGGLAAGFTLLALDEWRDAGAAPTAPPRLLALRFRRHEPLSVTRHPLSVIRHP
ncbi:MAG: class I SAM-dependent methyltransferase [Anaerolineales bacterium]|nr:class I SAM-dependent methyltransferase [Anaerolineales bacterium]